MRFELALVVGIIFFCCWCAYIIIKMNSSLTQQQQQINNSRTLLYRIEPDTSNSNSNSNSNNNDHHDNQLRDHYFGSHSKPIRGQPFGGQQSARPATWSPASQPAAAVVAPSAPQRVAEASSAGGQQAAGRARAELGPGREPRAQPAEEEEQEDGEGEGELDGEGEGGGGEESDPNDQGNSPPPGARSSPERRHSEQLESGRSFSQSDQESTERDRFGRPIRAYRRHLINGRPVEPAPGSAVAAAEDGTDFDRVVDEIEEADGDDDAQGEAGSADYDDQPAGRDSQQQQQQPEGSESRLVSAAAAAASRGPRAAERRLTTEGPQLEEIDEHSNDDSLPAGAKDSHRHRLKESLRAQQWDDEAGPAAGSGSSSRPDGRESAAGEEQPLESAAKGRQDDGDLRDRADDHTDQTDSATAESDVVFRDLDLLSDGRFPFLEAETEAEAEEVGAGPASQAPAEPEQRQRGKRSATELIGSARATDNLERELDNELAKAAPAAGARPAPHDNGPANKGTGQSSAATKHATDNENSAHQLAPTTARTGANIVVGQEDLSIEVLANPPTIEQGIGQPAVSYSQAANSQLAQPSNGHSFGPQQSNSFGQQEPTSEYVSPISGQPQRSLAEHQHDGTDLALTAPAQAGGGAPQVGHSDAANGNQVASQSRVEGTQKKKKRKKHAKKAAKYHAAKAASMKRKSKMKKGGAVKKKTKQGKKHTKSLKEFRGSTRGQKGAKGMGARGGKKGALYYKDKGYKKRGFKKNYQKVESGDHKTYFDEFRDKDHNKKWKDFKDKHHYSNGKKWAANDRRRYKNLSAKELNDKKYGSGSWKEKERSKFRKDYKRKSMEHNQGSKSKKKKKKTSKKRRPSR